MTTSELQAAIATNRGVLQLVDVRSAFEFAAGHIPGAMNIPLQQLEARLDDLRTDALIVLICQRGPRACMAATFLDGRRRATVLEGGTSSWQQNALPLVTSTSTRWSLERQVRLIAGMLVLAGSLLALTTHRGWLYLPAAVGLGLTVAGITDMCLMASVLAAMPWNRARKINSPQPARACCL